MTLRHINIFLAVCQHESVTKAANSLFISQPAVSLAIAELENYYGIKLFDRISKKMYLTQQGEKFFSYALHIQELVEKMEMEMKDTQQSGTLKIGASITISTTMLMPVISEFMKTHPNIKPQIFVENAQQIKQKILDNSLDVALIEDMSESEHIIQQVFNYDYLMPICPVDHPFAEKNVSLSKLEGENILAREKGSASRQILESVLLLNGINFNPVMESASNTALLEGARYGVGIAFVSPITARSYLEKGYIKSFSVNGINFPRMLRIIYHRQKNISRGMEDFIKLCSQFDWQNTES